MFVMVGVLGTVMLFQKIGLEMAKSHAANVMSNFSTNIAMQNGFEQRRCDSQIMDVVHGTGSGFNRETLPNGYKVEEGGFLSQAREVLHVPYGGVAEYSVVGIADASSILTGNFCQDAGVRSASASSWTPEYSMASFRSPHTYALMAEPAFIQAAVYRGSQPAQLILAGNGNDKKGGQEPGESVFGKLIVEKKPKKPGSKAHCSSDPHKDHTSTEVDQGGGNDLCGQDGTTNPSNPPSDSDNNGDTGGNETTNGDTDVSSGDINETDDPTQNEDTGDQGPGDNGDGDENEDDSSSQPPADDNQDETSDQTGNETPSDDQQGQPATPVTDVSDVGGTISEYPAHLTDIQPGQVAYTVTVYWENPSSKARALCRYMSFTDEGNIHMGAGPMGNNYTVRGASCDEDIPEFTVVYH